MNRTLRPALLIAAALSVSALAAPASANVPQPKGPSPQAPPAGKATDARAPAAAKASDRRDAAPPAAPTPAPELDKLKFLAAVHSCDVTRPASDGAPEQRYKGRFAGKLDLGGFFITFQYGDVKSKDHPAALSSSGFFGWDPGLRRYVFASADSSGLGFLLRADTPPVDQYEFKGNATATFNRHVPAVYTVTRTMKGFDVSAEGADADGQMMKKWQMSCVKGGK